MAQFPAPTEGIAISHFIVSRDVERSRRSYTGCSAVRRCLR
jgi:hypothetical protein